MEEPGRTNTLTVGGIGCMLTTLIVFGGVAALLFWLGGFFIIGGVIAALIGLLFLWRGVIQMIALRRGQW